jgi:hypothetical protein
VIRVHNKLLEAMRGGGKYAPLTKEGLTNVGILKIGCWNAQKIVNFQLP